jgi:hypothetical protein
LRGGLIINGWGDWKGILVFDGFFEVMSWGLDFAKLFWVLFGFYLDFWILGFSVL